MKLSSSLLELGKARAQELLSCVDEAAVDGRTKDELAQVAAISDFVYEQLRRNPLWLCDIGEYLASDATAGSAARLKSCLEGATDDSDIRSRLRKFRNFYMVVLAWQDLTRRFDIGAITAMLSKLAENIIVETYHLSYQRTAAVYGAPVGQASGKIQHMLLVAMGKLGGGELNFSSDIDLIFVYPEQGETTGGRRSCDNQTFFTKVAQSLIAHLNQITADGQVYRVDMRLRPFGDDGQLVLNFAATENYYVRHGRSWERYAMVKARALGDYCLEEADEFYDMLRPFVYRRYFDFGAIDALRKMKSMIEAEVRRRGLVRNIKLGEGGIREAEFVVQVFQLMRGGREPELQKRNLIEAIGVLAAGEVISSSSAESLSSGYLFFRKLENVLQEIGDKQTQLLPDSQTDQDRCAAAMGFDGWDRLEQAIAGHSAAIHAEFRDVVCDQSQAQDSGDVIWTDIWRSGLTAEEVTPLVRDCAGERAPEFAAMIVDLRKDILRRAAGPQGRETLNLLVPRILSLTASYEDLATLFPRIMNLIRSVSMRTTYLQLLYENHNVLDQVIYLCNASEQIADQLSAYPILMDELIYTDSLYQITTDARKLRSEIRQYLLRIDDDDLEQKMEALRQFKQIQLLKISASDIVGRLPLMRVSDFLTELAEAILAEVVAIAWREQERKYGVPPYVEEHGGYGLIAVAYGKLGGIELGYGSDLDLVFVHYTCEPEEMTTGAHPVSVRKFYVRLVQRIINLFSIRTSTGILYDIDLRLRPDGDSGLIVSTMHAFENYQMNEAWTWEHQALVRSRVVCGDGALGEQFRRIRRKVLSLERDRRKLAEDVTAMRAKMRQHLLKLRPGEFDLKQSAGGMVDIEFLAQYLVLAWASRYPEVLTRWSDNVRIFDSCVECAVVPPQAASALKQAYVNIRNEAHRCSLRGVRRVIEEETLQDDIGMVRQVWHEVFEGTGEGGD